MQFNRRTTHPAAGAARGHGFASVWSVFLAFSCVGALSLVPFLLFGFGQCARRCAVLAPFADLFSRTRESARKNDRSSNIHRLISRSGEQQTRPAAPPRAVPACQCRPCRRTPRPHPADSASNSRDVEPSASLLGSSAPLCRQLGSTGRGLARLGPRRHSQRAVMHRATTPAMCIEAQDQDQAGNSLSAISQPACSLKINCLEGRL